MEFTERAAEQIQATNSSNKENMGRNCSGAPVAAPEGTLSLLAPQARSAVLQVFYIFHFGDFVGTKAGLKSMCFKRVANSHINLIQING